METDAESEDMADQHFETRTYKHLFVGRQSEFATDSGLFGVRRYRVLCTPPLTLKKAFTGSRLRLLEKLSKIGNRASLNSDPVILYQHVPHDIRLDSA